MNNETLLETINDMIDAIESGNSFDAEKMFNAIMMTKIDDTLNQKKNEVAQSMFTGCSECDEEKDEMHEGPAVDAYMADKSPAIANYADKLDQGVEDQRERMKKKGMKKVSEELKGNQHKIDTNKNGKLDAHDFKMLRFKKKGMKEELENIDEANPVNKAKKNAFVQKVGANTPGPHTAKSAKQAGRATMRPQPHNSKVDAKDYKKSGAQSFWKKKGIGTGVHKEETQVDEAIVSAAKKPSMDAASAIATYRAEKQRRAEKAKEAAKRPRGRPKKVAAEPAPSPAKKKARSPEMEKARQLAKADMQAMRSSGQ